MGRRKLPEEEVTITPAQEDEELLRGTHLRGLGSTVRIAKLIKGPLYK